MRASLTWLGVAAALVCGCSDDAPRELPVLGEQQAPIINGSVDNSGQYEAVVAVFTSGSKCTGTIVGVQPPYAFVLTAAHCVDDEPPQVVRQGVDHDNPTAEYTVQDYAIHPGYNDSVNDFAMIRVTGASASIPTRQVLTAAEDNLAAGTTCTHLGYGNIAPGTGTNLRHITTGQVTATTSLTVTFDETSSGVCFGDSGGPNFHPNGKVAGVNSAVSGNNCNVESYSGRASAVLATFINPFINNSPPPPVDCDGCFEAATTGTGACMTAVNGCFNNATCDALVSCFNGCSTQSCINQCASTHSGGVNLYNAIFDCVCDSACMTECETASMCTSATPPPTTSSVAQSSVAADAAAATTSSGVGGGGVGGSGAGGAPATTGAGAGNGFVAGDSENKSPDGIIQVTPCAYSPLKSKRYAWLLLCAAGLAARRRRSA